MTVGEAWILAASLLVLTIVIYTFWDDIYNFVAGILSTPTNTPAGTPVTSPTVAAVPLPGAPPPLDIGAPAGAGASTQAESPRTTRIMSDLARQNQEFAARLDRVDAERRREQAIREAQNAVENFSQNSQAAESPTVDANDQNAFLDDLDGRLEGYGEVLAADAGRNVPTIGRQVSGNVQQSIALMAQTSASPHRIWTQLCKGYREVDPVSWPFGAGFKRRLALRFLSSVYANNIWAGVWYKREVIDRRI